MVFISTSTLLVVGDAGVGKTTFINRHRTGEFVTKYTPSVCIDTKSLPIDTNHGLHTFTIRDAAGQDRYVETNYDYMRQSNACIIMFDVTNTTSYKNVAFWRNKVKEMCGDIPIVLCGNKVDCRDRKILPKDIINQQLYTTYFDISAKSCYNFEKPFLSILRQLTEIPELIFVG